MRAHACEFSHGPDKDKTGSLGTRVQFGTTKSPSSRFFQTRKKKRRASRCLPHPLRHSLIHWGLRFGVEGIVVCGLGSGIGNWGSERNYTAALPLPVPPICHRCSVPCPRSRQKVMFSRGSNRRAMVGCDVADTSVVLSIIRAGQAERFVVLTRASHTTADRGARLHSLLTGSSSAPPPKTVYFGVLLAFFLPTASRLRGLGVVDFSPGTLNPEPSGSDLGGHCLVDYPPGRVDGGCRQPR